MYYNEEGATTIVNFFNGFTAKKAMTIRGFVVAFFGGFVTKKMTLAMLSPSSMVVLLRRR
jgi:hypothetical protein